MQFAEHSVEIVFAAAMADQRVQFPKAMQHPALQLRHLGWPHPLRRVEFVQVAQQVAHGVAQPAVHVDLPLDDLRPDPQVLRIVRGDDPQAQRLGAILFGHVLRRHDIAQRFRHLAAVLGHDETVGQHALIGRAAARAASFQQRGMEPAAMLVGAFQIQRRRPLQIVARFQHEGVCRARIEPDVHDIRDLLVILGITIVAKEIGRVAGEPGVGALGFEGLGDAVDNVLVAQRFAARFFHEDRDRHAPGALARDTPVGPALDHRIEPRAARGRVEFGLVDGGQRLASQIVRLHRDEPLRRIAEDQRCLRPPAMRIAVAQLTGRHQVAGLAQRLDDGLVGRAGLAVLGINRQPRKQRNMVVIGAILADGLGNLDAVGRAQYIVVGAMTRRDMDETGAVLFADEVARQQAHVEIVAFAVERMPADGSGKLDALEGRDVHAAADAGRLLKCSQQALRDNELVRLIEGAFVLAVHDLLDHVIDILAIGDGAVAWDGPGRRGPDHHAGAFQLGPRRLGHGETHMDRGRGVVVILDLGLGQGGLFDHRPHHRLGALEEPAVHQELADLAGDLRLGGIGHGGIGIFPVATDAEAFELLALHVDPVRGEFAAFLAELDDRHLVLVLAGGAVLLLDLPFDRQAVAVPAGHVMGVLAHHLLRAVDDVLQDLVQRVTDMQMAVRIGRAVMQDEFLLLPRLLAQPRLEADLLPALQQQRFLLGQTRLHGEVRPGQAQGILVIDAHRPRSRSTIIQ